MRVQDNEQVNAGQILFVIDDRDFAAKVAQATAAVASEEAMVATYGTRHDFQEAMINQAAAAVDAAEAELTRADLDQKRYVALVTGDVATRQRFETAEADARKAAAALLKAKAALEAEKQQLAVIEAQKREEEARLLQARATLQLAQNDLDNTVIRAPVAGIAGNRAGQTGQYVKPGTQLLSLVPLPQVYVTANFKETQLTLMRPGQAAAVSVDAYPDQTIIGRVDSFAPGSGAQFSLLPPDNATGNFTKIVQRVPVRIAPAAGQPARVAASPRTFGDGNGGHARSRRCGRRRRNRRRGAGRNETRRQMTWTLVSPLRRVRSPRPVAPAAAAPPPAAASPVPARQIQPASLRQWVGVLAMVFGMFMALLDIQIVTSSLTQIQGGLSASADEISWVQTSYLIAEVVMVPMTGMLSRLMSTRILFVAATTGFTVTSVLCATATSLGTMIFYRILQGFLSGAMIPTVFPVVYTIFPPRQLAVVMVLISLILNLSSTVGPSLGGYLTDTYSWQWLFLVNIVPGIIVSATVWWLIDVDRPNLSLLARLRSARPGADGAVSRLPRIRARGGRTLGLVRRPDDPRHGDRLGGFGGAVLLAGADLSPADRRSARFSHPQFRDGHALQLRRRHRALLRHLRRAAVPRPGARVLGLADRHHRASSPAARQIVTSPFTAWIARKIDLRLMLAIGMSLFAFAMYLTAGLTNQASFDELLVPQIVRGVALMFCFLPANLISLGSLPPDLLRSSAGLYNLMRNLGGAIGLAVLGTVMNDRLHFHWNRLIEAVNPARPVGPAFPRHADCAARPAFHRRHHGGRGEVAGRHRPTRGAGADLQRRHADDRRHVRVRPLADTAAAPARRLAANAVRSTQTMQAAFPALVAILALTVYIGTFINAGRMRHRFDVKAPSVTGPPEFERALRVQQNTLEQIVWFLPSLWLFVLARVAGLGRCNRARLGRRPRDLRDLLSARPGDARSGVRHRHGQFGDAADRRAGRARSSTCASRRRARRRPCSQSSTSRRAIESSRGSRKRVVVGMRQQPIALEPSGVLELAVIDGDLARSPPRRGSRA